MTIQAARKIDILKRWIVTPDDEKTLLYGLVWQEDGYNKKILTFDKHTQMTLTFSTNRNPEFELIIGAHYRSDDDFYLFATEGDLRSTVDTLIKLEEITYEMIEFAEEHNFSIPRESLIVFYENHRQELEEFVEDLTDQSNGLIETAQTTRHQLIDVESKLKDLREGK